MASKKRDQRRRTHTFLRHWREFRRLTQEQAADRLGLDQGTLSRIERGIVPYNQDFLEAAAYAYQCSPADLLMRNPLDENAVWSIADNLMKATPAQRSQAAAVIDALLKKAN